MVRGYRQKRALDLFFTQYSSAINNKSYQIAYEMADNEFKNITSFSEFVNIYQSINEKYGDPIDLERGRTIVEGTGTPMEWYASMDLKIKFKSDTLNIRYWFHVIDENWKLHGFEKLNEGKN